MTATNRSEVGTEEASGFSDITADHELIRRWVEARGGQPARIKGTGLLRIDFPGFAGENTLEPISWDEFFRLFEESDHDPCVPEPRMDG